MSRIGQKIIEVPENVEVNLSSKEIKLVGPKGELATPIFEGAEIKLNDLSATYLTKSLSKVMEIFASRKINIGNI